MSEAEILARKLAIAEQQLASKDRQIEEEKRRADKAEQQREEEKTRADKAEQKTQRTTLQEYLGACQKHVLSRVRLNDRGYLTTKTSTAAMSEAEILARKLAIAEQQLASKDRQIEEEKRRAEEEKTRAEEEKTRAEEEKTRAEEEKTRADKAEQQREEEKTRADKAEQKTQRTTLPEYLGACQEHVLSRVRLNDKGYLTSKKPSTDPTNKHCPKALRPWEDFIDTQRQIITKIDRIVPKDARLFESDITLEQIGQRIYHRPVNDEPGLVYVQNAAVEDPVRTILDEMKDLHPEQYGLALHGGVQFQTTAKSLRDELDGQGATKQATERDAKLRTDQVCVLRRDNTESIAYVIEYKAPHRLNTIHLDKGLRPMDIVDEIVNKPTIPTSSSEKFVHIAELLTAAAITQTYHYMIEAGLEYGCLANGDAFVFLKIDWSHPKTLFYHLAQPQREVVVDEDPVYSNAVCQLLAFTILALQSQQHTNDERTAATLPRHTWLVDFDVITMKCAELEEPATPGSRKHRRVPSSPDWLPSPIKKRRRSPEQHIESDRVLRSHNRRDDPGGGSSGGGSAGHSSGGYGGGSPSQHGASGSTSGSATALGDASGASQSQNRQYCTPLCLLSLISGRLLDKNCPNAMLHSDDQQTHADGRPNLLRKHPVSYTQWMVLLQKQLTKTLDKGVVVLGKEGACGALFQLTLLQYGYTFVAKGVTGRAVPQLQHEEAVYQKLQALQGRQIPVCLGSVDLRALGQVYYYYFDVRIIRFLLLSYGGTPLLERPDGEMGERFSAFVKTVQRQMRELGVVHGDLRLPNVLQSPTGHFTVIDFDQARLLPSAGRGALGEIAPNKRKQLSAEDDGEEGMSQAKKVRLAPLGEEADETTDRSFSGLA